VAVFQAAQVAAMVLALCTSDYPLLRRALDDRIAEPARAPLLPGFSRAKQAALEAREHALGAQREALARREDERQRSRQIVAEIDHLLSDLEELYSKAAEGKDKAATGHLLAVMRDARETGAVLFLAFEQGNFRKVISEGEAAKVHLGEAKLNLEASRKK